MNNVNCKILDIEETRTKKKKTKNIEYNEIMNLVDISIEEKDNKNNKDLLLALEIFYNENYIKSELEKIADYYNISKRKKKKNKLIKNIVEFECEVENEYITNRRKTMWFYISELENDEIMSKYIIFN
jgi:hypothetical protein